MSGAAIPVSETTLDQARNEMTLAGMKPETVAEIITVMKLQYRYAQTGTGWNEYATARAALAGRLGQPPDTFPATPEHPSWRYLRLVYLFDPAAPLRQLQTPTLGLFGGLDKNIVAGRNRPVWEAALSSAGNRDYTMVVLANANHTMLEAKTGSNAEAASLRRFAPEYFTTVHDWLSKRVRGYAARR